MYNICSMDILYTYKDGYQKVYKIERGKRWILKRNL